VMIHQVFIQLMFLSTNPFSNIKVMMIHQVTYMVYVTPHSTLPTMKMTLGLTHHLR
jgi:hypothetical protein